MSPRAIAIAVLLLIALVTVAYAPVTFGGAGFIWDDDLHVTNLRPIHLPPLEALKQIWLWPLVSNRPATPQYYPATFTSFYLEHAMWGKHPLGYHITNIVLHLLSAFALWAILVRARLLSAGTAFFAAALFALHPVHVESVAWISERKNTLSTLLFLLSALAFVRWAAIGEDSTTTPASKPRKRTYILALVLFFFALMSKTVTCVLPVALLLLAWYRGRLNVRVAYGLAIFFVMALLAGLWTIHVERTFIGATGEDFDIPLLHRFLIANRALVFYAQTLLAPVQLTFIYPRWEVNPADITWWLFAAGTFVSLSTLALLAYLKPAFRGVFLAVLFFIAAIFPALGFINFYPMLYSFVADHFQYLASIGLLIVIAAAGANLVSFLDAPARKIVATLCILVITGMLTFLSYRQSRIYHNLETLWLDTIAKNRGSWMALHNLGDVYVAARQPERSLPLYQQARKIRPQDTKIYNSEGVALLQMGRVEEAEIVVAQGLDLDPEDFLLNMTLGDILNRRGYYAQAEVNLLRAVEANAHSSEAWNNLGLARRNQGTPEKVQEAVEAFERAIELDDQNAIAFNNLGVALLSLGKINQAEHRFTQATKRQPRFAEAWLNLGRVRFLKSQHLQALEAYRKALDIDPRFGMALYSMGETLGKMGREDDAISYLRAALYVDREMASALGALAEILSNPKNPRNRNALEAIELAQRAVQVTRETDPVLLDILAQVYAEAGRYGAAIETVRKGIKVVESSSHPNQTMIDDMQRRLELYLLAAQTRPPP